MRAEVVAAGLPPGGGEGAEPSLGANAHIRLGTGGYVVYVPIVSR